jgi:uncharacterized protein YyaL (SSP411 family)
VPEDNAIPSGNSMAATALLRLAKLTGRADLFEKAETTLRAFQNLMASHPMAAGQMLTALDFYLGPVEEIAVVGDPGHADTQQVLRLLRGRFQPRQVLALKSPAAEISGLDQLVPLLAGKTAQGAVTAYICQDFTCQAPLVGVEAVASGLHRSDS